MKVEETNVSRDEVNRFKEMASFWWDADGPMKALIDQKPQLIVPYILKGLAATKLITNEQRTSKSALKNLKILDVGGGGGILAENLAALKGDVTSLDPSDALIRVAKEHAVLSELKINYICQTVEDHCIENKEKYGVVTLIEVIEHVPDVRSIIKASVECLKPGGTIFISTINRTFMAWLGVVVLIEYVFRINPRGTHHCKMFVTPKEVKEILRECGCRVLDVTGNTLGLFSRAWSHSFYKGFAYSLYAVKEK